MEINNHFVTYDGEETSENKQLKYDDLNKPHNCMYKKYKPRQQKIVLLKIKIK